MPVTDPIADMLTRIRNAVQAGHPRVSIPSSRLKVSIAQVLADEGFIKEYAVQDRSGAAGRDLQLELLYREDGSSVLSGLKRVSRPGLRVYVQRREIPVPTAGSASPSSPPHPRGVMTGHRARREKPRRRGPLLRLVSPLSSQSQPANESDAAMSRVGRNQSPCRPMSMSRSTAAASASPAPKARFEQTIHADLHAVVDGAAVIVTRPSDRRVPPRSARAGPRADQQHGARRLAGLSENARNPRHPATAPSCDGATLVLRVGFSHLVRIDPPDGN